MACAHFQTAKTVAHLFNIYAMRLTRKHWKMLFHSRRVIYKLWTVTGGLGFVKTRHLSVCETYLIGLRSGDYAMLPYAMLFQLQEGSPQD
ncbi:hypothetical protein TNCV_2339041 [Trichonephila clavipes]|nr:hypothetical protein TNCV_2339041 [Trichonephila clavipes]